MKTPKQFLPRYVPEQANPMELFFYFGVAEFSFDRQGASIVLSILSRLDKSSILWSHLQELCEVAHSKEGEEINRYGYTNARYTKLASAIFEAILDEYYSIYSNFALIVRKIYPKDNLPERWSRLKNRAIEGRYSTIPSKIIDIFKSNEIFDELRKIRTESAHYSTGYLSTVSKPYSYMNEQVGPIGRTPSNILLIPDIDKFYHRLRSETINFLNRFFSVRDG
jgi:hypothetical protein